MDMIEHVPILLLVGSVAGFFAGLLGIGGGAITIPALFLVLGTIGVPTKWLMHTAVATSLAIIVATSLSSIYAHHRKANVAWPIIRGWWIFIAAGATAGSFFAKSLKTEQLVYIFATLLLLLAVKMLVPMERFKLGKALPGGLLQFLSPTVIGFFSSVMGIGGGSFSVPYLTLYSVPIHRAVGTAAVLGLVISISGGLGYIVTGLGVSGLPPGMIGFVHLPSVIIVALGGIVFAPLGAKAAHSLPKLMLSIVFGLFLVVAAVRMLSAV